MSEMRSCFTVGEKRTSAAELKLVARDRVCQHSLGGGSLCLIISRLLRAPASAVSPCLQQFSNEAHERIVISIFVPSIHATYVSCHNFIQRCEFSCCGRGRGSRCSIDTPNTPSTHRTHVQQRPTQHTFQQIRCRSTDSIQLIRISMGVERTPVPSVNCSSSRHPTPRQ